MEIGLHLIHFNHRCVKIENRNYQIEPQGKVQLRQDIVIIMYIFIIKLIMLKEPFSGNNNMIGISTKY